jgi:hypothetical protein
MHVTRYKRRHWAVRDTDETLICLCVYKKGAQEVVRRLCVQERQSNYALPERRKTMGAYVAFPAHLVEELLALLPPDERPVYAERFEPVVGDLVWVRADAENAVEAALSECVRNQGAPLPTLTAELTDALLDFENDSLVGMVTEFLHLAARALMNDRCERKPDASRG